MMSSIQISSATRKRRRRAVIKRDGLACHWCGVECVEVIPTRNGIFPSNMATLDHVRARWAGGSHDLDNLVLACRDCNQRRSVEQFTEQQARLMAAE
jgi:5-methylcytosine-specific restriction endonuclease McrA